MTEKPKAVEANGLSYEKDDLCECGYKRSEHYPKWRSHEFRPTNPANKDTFPEKEFDEWQYKEVPNPDFEACVARPDWMDILCR